MKDLLVVLPSRGRPHNLDRLWKAMQDTCQGDTTLLVGLDDDDDTRDRYPDGPQYEVRPGMQGMVTGWLNTLAVPRVDEYRFIGHFGDDCVPHTPGWDVAMMEALAETPFAFGDDMEYSQRPRGSLCTHIFMRSAVVSKLGYFGPPSIKHMYVDLAWMTWGRVAGITYLPDVQIEHCHFMEGKAPFDESYQRSRQGVSEGYVAMAQYAAGKLERDIRKLCPGVKHFRAEEFYAMHRSHGLGV